MEELKVSDKRKAPDKNASTEDESDVSQVRGAPLKRPRMELDTEEIENDPFAFPGDEPLGIHKIEEPSEIIYKESESHSLPLAKIEEQLSPEENGTGEKEKKEELPVVEKVETTNGGQFFKDIIGREDSPALSPPPIDPTEDNNNEEEPLEKPSITSHIRTEKSHPTVTSSPHSDVEAEVIESPSTEIQILIRAYEPTSRRSIFDETIKSDFGRLDSFLRLHNVTLSQSSFGGYLGDVSSQENSAPTSYRNRNRWTSSTLGSVIPRDSIKTIETISPSESPIEDATRNSTNNNKLRGRHEPKLTSTKMSDYSSGTGMSSSGKLSKVSVAINGDESTNGLDTTAALSAKSSSDKPKNSSMKTEVITDEGVSTPTSKASKIKTEKKATPAKRPSVDKKPESIKKKGGRTPRTGSREFSGLSSLNLTPTLPVDPSPVRIIAKIEGLVAKPTTKFEAEVNNEPVDKSVLSQASTLWGSIAPSELVFARWRDKNYYSGVVKHKGLNDTWIIDYDDGMDDPASETHILPIKILGVGLQGVYSPDGCFKPGDAVVLGQKFMEDPEVGSTVKYAIQLEGESKPIWCTRRQLSIREKSARTLRSEFMPTPKIFKAAEVSLENIVLGSRHRATATSANPVAAAKIVGGAFDVSIAEENSTPESKRNSKSKTIKRRRKLSESSTVSDVSKGSVTVTAGPSKASNVDELVEPASTKVSPKKSKAKDSSVFEGYQFFLTASGGGDPAATAGAGSPIPVINYDKDEYRDLIESQGGKVIDYVGEETGKEKIFLVSDNYARTVKYIYCLAGSIPCVSHKWIQKCLDESTIVEWKTYELNSGWSLEQTRVIPSHRQKPLKGFKIYITAGSDDLYNYWKPVLTAAQATLLKPKKSKAKTDREPCIPNQAEVLVTDATCSPEVLADAQEKRIPVVKPEWLVQTIITGKKADFAGDEKYQVEALDPDDYEGDEDEEEDEEEEDQS